MAKRQTAEETSDVKRNIVPLTPETNVLVNRACDRWRLSKTGFVGRLVEFFSQSPESIQQLMLVGAPGDMREDFVRRAAEHFAAAGSHAQSGELPIEPADPRVPDTRTHGTKVGEHSSYNKSKG